MRGGEAREGDGGGKDSGRRKITEQQRRAANDHPTTKPHFRSRSVESVDQVSPHRTHSIQTHTPNIPTIYILDPPILALIWNLMS